MKHIQFGNTFDLLHAAASFIVEHQNSIGVAGVLDKYGKWSWAHYSAFWTRSQFQPRTLPLIGWQRQSDRNPRDRYRSGQISCRTKLGISLFYQLLVKAKGFRSDCGHHAYQVC